MRITLDRALNWMTAFAVVFSLYAHTFFDADSAEVTPISAMAIAGGLMAMSSLWFVRMRLATASSRVGIVASFCLMIALALTAISGVSGIAENGFALSDLGLFLLIVGVPVLIYCNSDRAGLLAAIGFSCAAFALLDAVVNAGAVAGLWAIQDAGGRYVAGSRIERFGGLTGNSHASGVVAFIGVAFLARNGSRLQPTWALALTICGIAAITASLFLIDARRYLLQTVLLVGMLFAPGVRFVPLQIASAITAFGGLIFAWQSSDPEELQRAALMASGWRDAASNLLTGQGVMYRAPTGNDFNALWSARVTESGVLDLAIQFGWAATVLFLVGVMLALGGRRKTVTWPAVLLAVMAGELAYGNPLDGFLGAIAFYAALIWVICDEGRTAGQRETIRTPAYA